MNSVLQIETSAKERKKTVLRIYNSLYLYWGKYGEELDLAGGCWGIICSQGLNQLKVSLCSVWPELVQCMVFIPLKLLENLNEVGIITKWVGLAMEQRQWICSKR